MYDRVLRDELQFPDDRAMDQDTKSLIRGVSHCLLLNIDLSKLVLIVLALTTRPCAPHQRATNKTSSLLLDDVRAQICCWIWLITCTCLLQRLVTCVLQALSTFVRHPSLSCNELTFCTAPYIPPIDPSNAGDTQNFDHTFLDMKPVINDENDMDTDQEREQIDEEPTDGEDSVATPSQSRSSSAQSPDDLMDLFDGYSFKGRHSVIIEDEGEEDLGATGRSILAEPNGTSVADTVVSIGHEESSPEPKTPEALAGGEIRTERDEEGEDWDFINTDDKRLDVQGKSLFAHGFIDRYRLADIGPGAIDNSTGAINIADSPSPMAKQRWGFINALPFRSTTKTFPRSESLLSASTQSSLSRGRFFRISDRFSRSTISTMHSLHTARTTLGEPSLKSRSSTVTVDSYIPSRNASTSDAGTTSDVDII
jgi:hypothetical protein